ncbi:pyridoxal phosphate-dependent aminotransferase [Pseudonocardiaceae bacterium YIM PH 21723]|nr:pyridoxal phosphate-dependent aminotransferase [Pseudonocardiaceae bacterium YIM PH 21723]
MTAIARTRFSSRASGLTGSKLVDLLRLAHKREAIDLAVGTPGAPHTPEAMIEEAVATIRSGRNQYADPSGDLTVRTRLAESLPTPADPERELTITVGATEGLCVALLASIDPGDEVIVFEPFYENFLSAITMAGGIPKFVPMRAPDWRYDPAELAAAFGPRTRAVVVNSPSNPTGRVLDLREWDEIAELCVQWDVTLISDEVYAPFVFDGGLHVSAADVPMLRGRNIVVGSLSKSHAVSGWRLGYLRADQARTTVLRRVHEVTTNGTAAPLQLAAAKAGVFGTRNWDPAPVLAERRDLATEIFTEFGLSVLPSQGGCYFLADISPVTTEGSESFVHGLLTSSAVLVVPGALFVENEDRAGRFVRVAFNRSVDTLQAARRHLRAGGEL